MEWEGAGEAGPVSMWHVGERCRCRQARTGGGASRAGGGAEERAGGGARDEVHKAVAPPLLGHEAHHQGNHRIKGQRGGGQPHGGPVLEEVILQGCGGEGSLSAHYYDL